MNIFFLHFDFRSGPDSLFLNIFQAEPDPDPGKKISDLYSRFIHPFYLELTECTNNNGYILGRIRCLKYGFKFLDSKYFKRNVKITYVSGQMFTYVLFWTFLYGMVHVY